MDAVAAPSRGNVFATRDPENGVRYLDAAENETAKRTDRYHNTWQEAYDTARVNHLPLDRADRLKFHLEVMHAIDNAINKKGARFTGFKSEVAEVKARYDAYRDLLDSEIKYRRTSRTTQAWTSFSGFNGFLLCFGLGTLAASGLANPWLALLISPFVWTLTERLIPMIRATSWPNKHAEVDYPLIMRISARKVRDQWRQCFGLHAKKYLVKGQEMTASEYRKILSLWKAWKGKAVTDDLPYFSYTFWYSVRNIVLTSTLTAAFFHSDAYLPVSLLSLAAAGCLAGASTAMIFQAARRCVHRNANPRNWRDGETIVKSTNLWNAEKKLLEAKLALLETYEFKAGANGRATSFAFVKSTLRTEISRAGMKSWLLTSIAYEISRLWQKKSTPGDDDPSEVASNRISALCGVLGKATCLLPAVLFSALVTTQYAGVQFSIAQSIAVQVAQNTLLIMGFSFRKECEFPWLYMIALVFALVDGLNHCRGKEDKYAHNNETPEVEDISGDMSDNAGATKECDSEASTSFGLVDPKKQSSRAEGQNPDGASDSDETQSEKS